MCTGAKPFSEMSESDDDKSYDTLGSKIDDKRPVLASEKNHPKELLQLIGDCWQIDPSLRPEFIAICERLSKIQNDIENGKNEKHVMISYSWSDQPLAKEIYFHLRKRNFKVWMDMFGGMQNKIFRSMARAVEDAFVILPLVSQEYQDSPCCEMELIYSIGKKLPIIPIIPIIATPWKPKDGWLAISISREKYIDFSDNKKFNEKIEELSLDIVKEQSK